MRIRDIRERRRALVGGDDEVRIVVVAEHARRRRYGAVDDVVGDVEQAADERLIARDALALDRLAVAGW